MELFLPSLFVLLIAGIFAFLVIPRIGPAILASISLVALIAVGIHHYNLFYSEYALSTWQNGLRAYAPFVILGFGILFIIAAIFYMFSGGETKAVVENILTTPMEAIQNAVEASANAMPSANTATNPITAAINSSIKAITNIPATITGNSTKTNNSGVKVNNTSPTIPGLGFKASQI